MKSYVVSNIISSVVFSIGTVLIILSSNIAPEVKVQKEIQIVEVPVYKYNVMHDGFEVKYSPREREMLAGIVHAEAGNQDMIGKRLVVDVILNRVDDDAFPDNVVDVIKQDGQFTDPSNVYTADDLRAVDAELNNRLDYDIIFFRTKKYHVYGAPAYQHGDHFFSVNNDDEIL